MPSGPTSSRQRSRVRLTGALAAAVVAAGAGAWAIAGRDEPAGPDVPAAAAPAPAPDAAPPPAGRRPRAADTVRIPAGTYLLGSAASADEGPEHRVRLRAFRLDRFEVTNAQYARYLDATGVRPVGDAAPGEAEADLFPTQDARLFIEGDDGQENRPLIALDDEHARIGLRDGRFVAGRGWADHPVSEVSWEGARRYAAWVGGRLPTEAEWEAAARGREGRTYPWGDGAPTAARAVFGRGSGETLPVGTHPEGATAEGVHDLAGNVDEWTSSLYRAYPYRASDGREGAGAPGEERVTRGGNHVYSSAEELRSAYRRGFSREPDRGHRHIGFRVAHSITG